MSLPIIANPIRVTAAETWVVRGQGITIKSVVWQSITADGSTLILSKDNGSAETTRICKRNGKEGIDINVFPNGNKAVSYFYVQEMTSGFLEIELD